MKTSLSEMEMGRLFNELFPIGSKIQVDGITMTVKTDAFISYHASVFKVEELDEPIAVRRVADHIG